MICHHTICYAKMAADSAAMSVLLPGYLPAILSYHYAPTDATDAIAPHMLPLLFKRCLPHTLRYTRFRHVDFRRRDDADGALISLMLMPMMPRYVTMPAIRATAAAMLAAYAITYFAA